MRAYFLNYLWNFIVRFGMYTFLVTFSTLFGKLNETRIKILEQLMGNRFTNQFLRQSIDTYLNRIISKSGCRINMYECKGKIVFFSPAIAAVVSSSRIDDRSRLRKDALSAFGKQMQWFIWNPFKISKSRGITCAVLAHKNILNSVTAMKRETKAFIFYN